MNVTTLSVNNRTAMVALALVLMASGWLCYRSMPLESDPEIKLPVIVVETDWRGASPTDVERSITVKIEDKLKGLNGVKRVKSTSSEGRSEITIEFDPGVDIDFALQRVKDKVDLARPDLPSDLEDEPAVTEFSFAEIPVAGFCLSAGASGDDLRLGRLAERLRDELEALPGVLEVELSGQLEREIQIQLHPERMALYGLTASDVVAAVRKEHVNVSGGVYRQGEGGRLAVRLEAEIREVDELLALAVRASGAGDAVYLRDVADVVDGAKDRDSRARVNTRPTVTLLLKKRLGANVVEAIDRAKAHVDDFARRLPPGYTLTTVSDSAKEIRQMVSDLSNNLATGFLLVTAVVALALGVRNGLVVALIIPITMLAAFIPLKLLV